MFVKHGCSVADVGKGEINSAYAGIGSENTLIIFLVSPAVMIVCGVLSSLLLGCSSVTD